MANNPTNMNELLSKIIEIIDNKTILTVRLNPSSPKPRRRNF